LLPLYTGEGTVRADRQRHLAGTQGGAPGLTRAQIEEAKRNAVQPTGGGGFAYMQGPEGALVEYVGDFPRNISITCICGRKIRSPRLTGTEAPQRAASGRVYAANGRIQRGAERSWPSLTQDGMFREPRAGVVFGDVVLTWYANQWDTPWRRRGNVARPYRSRRRRSGCLGRQAPLRRRRIPRTTLSTGRHARVMIEGPSREALELVEVRETL